MSYLSIVEDGTDAVRDVDDASDITGDYEQEAIGRLQYQMFQLLVREEGGLVGTVGAGVTCPWTQNVHL